MMNCDSAERDRAFRLGTDPRFEMSRVQASWDQVRTLGADPSFCSFLIGGGKNH